MCGIIGYVGDRQVLPILVDGLRRLEYRGYDSAGVAVVRDGEIELRRAPGKLAEPRKRSSRKQSARGRTTASATRAGRRTAGRPRRTRIRIATARGRIVVVHNGIIENYLRADAAARRAKGTRSSPRPTPRSSRTSSSRSQARATASRTRSARALHDMRGALRARASCPRTTPTRSSPPQRPARSSSASARGENFVASDIPAILAHTRDVIFLEDGEMAVLTPHGVDDHRLSTARAVSQDRARASPGIPVTAEKGGYKHFMLKEIHEQPRAITRHAARPRRRRERRRASSHEIDLADEDAARRRARRDPAPAARRGTRRWSASS